MNYLLAKTEGARTPVYNVLSQEREIYSLPDLDNTHAYDDEYKLEDGQWFVVEDFNQKDYCPDLLCSPFDPTAYGVLPRDHYPKLDYVLAVQTDNHLFCFQKITSSKVLQKRMLSFSMNEAPTLLDAGYLIVLNQVPDAIYDAATQRLYFRNLSAITKIFKGIDELYREATDEETQAFMKMELLQVAPDYTIDKVKKANRQRIKAAMEKYNAFTPEQRQAIPPYLHTYCPALPIDEATGKFQISNEKELTELLNGLNQRYYTTEIDKEKRLANSVTRLVK